jgi:hypothetical protein
MNSTQHDLRDRVAALPDALAEAARAADPRPPAPGEWPPTDIVRHLIAVESDVWKARLRQLLALDEPHWASVEPDRWDGVPGASLDDLLAIFADLRRTTTATLDGLDDSGWGRTGVHETFGRLDVAGLLVRLIDHDEEHIASLRPAEDAGEGQVEPQADAPE